MCRRKNEHAVVHVPQKRVNSNQYGPGTLSGCAGRRTAAAAAGGWAGGAGGAAGGSAAASGGLPARAGSDAAGSSHGALPVSAPGSPPSSFGLTGEGRDWRPRRWALPITALRETPPKSSAIWL